MFFQKMPGARFGDPGPGRQLTEYAQASWAQQCCARTTSWPTVKLARARAARYR